MGNVRGEKCPAVSVHRECSGGSRIVLRAGFVSGKNIETPKVSRGRTPSPKKKNEFFAEILHFAALLQALNKFLIINSKISETHMHSLESNASPATSQRSVVDVTDCRISVASQDTAVGRMSPNINIATPNLVSLRRPPGELYSSRRLDTRAFGARPVPPFQNPGSAPDLH